MENPIIDHPGTLRVAGAWLACLLLLCGVWLGSILYFLRSAQTANSIRFAANRIRIHELEARRAEKDFVLRSLTDPAFFRDGNSVYLKRHKAKVSALTSELDRLSTEVPSDQRASLLRLLEMVRRYEQGFRKLVAAHLERGYGEGGLVGALANAQEKLKRAVAAHNSSAPEGAPRNLSWTDQEFGSSPRPEHVSRIVANLASIRESVAKTGRSAQTHDLLVAVDEYETALAAFSALEDRIGPTEESGLQREFREAIHAVEPAVEEILSDAVRADENASRTLLVGIFVACCIMATLLGVALFFAHAATLRNRRLVQMNQQMEEDHRRLLQSERLAAIGQMVAGLAHESRNAFQRTHACLDLLAQEVKDRPEALSLVSRIEESQDHIHLLYEQVREYAAPLRIDRAPALLDAVALSAWDHLELLRQGRNIRLNQRLGDVDLRCKVDAFALEQVFRNILENSFAACEDPVEIEVRYSNARIGSLPAVEVSLLDNGPGLESEQIERIFDPFYTTKIKGTGLGMAIAKRLVEAHGGTISVGPSNGQGTEIVVAVPRNG